MAGTTNASTVDRSDRDAGAGRGRGERVALAALALGIAGLGFATLRPFVVPFLWAALLAYLSWPAFRRLRSMLGRPNLSALAMICTAALTLAAAGLVLSMVLKTQLLDNFKTLVWGTVIVGLVDNVARPLLISSFTRVHLLVATLGVIGGVTAFGLIGLFVGPVILSLLLSVWRGWLATAPGHDAGSVREPVPALLTAAPSERAPDC